MRISFSKKLNEGFSRVFDSSPCTVEDPIVKLQHVAKGNNIVAGRTLKGENYSELFYLGKVSEQCVGKSYLNADV